MEYHNRIIIYTYRIKREREREENLLLFFCVCDRVSFLLLALGSQFKKKKQKKTKQTNKKKKLVTKHRKANICNILYSFKKSLIKNRRAFITLRPTVNARNT